MPWLSLRSKLCSAPLLDARRDCKSSPSDPPPLLYQFAVSSAMASLRMPRTKVHALRYVAATALAEELSSTARTQAVGRGGNIPGSTGRHSLGKASNRYRVAPLRSRPQVRCPLIGSQLNRPKLLLRMAALAATALAGLPLHRV